MIYDDFKNMHYKVKTTLVMLVKIYVNSLTIRLILRKMTITDEILIAANKLANAGKKPTVALIKAKLNQSVPLPLLISTLKGWQHQPEFIGIPNELNKTTSQPFDELRSTPLENDVVKALIQETLAEELKQMKTELSDIKQLIESLSKQLKVSNKN